MPVLLLLLLGVVVSARGVWGAEATRVRLDRPATATCPCLSLSLNHFIRDQQRHAVPAPQAVADLSDLVPRGVVSLRLRGNPGAQAETHGVQPLRTEPRLVIRHFPCASHRHLWCMQMHTQPSVS